MTRLRSTEFDSIEATSWVSSLKTEEEEEKEDPPSPSMQRFI
jgi:hypothetical protein